MKDIQIRPMETGDREFIFATWLHNYKHSSAFAKRIRNDIFYWWHQRIITSIIGRESTTVSVACLPDTPDVILGYGVFEDYDMAGSIKPVIHFMFVKKEWRKMAIARGLIELNVDTNSECYFSHWTDPIDAIVNRKDIKLTYDPYKI